MSYDVSHLDVPAWTRETAQNKQDYHIANEEWKRKIEIISRYKRESSDPDFQDAYRNLGSRVNEDYMAWQVRHGHLF